MRLLNQMRWTDENENWEEEEAHDGYEKTEYRFSLGDKMRVSRDIIWKTYYKQNFMQDFPLNRRNYFFFGMCLMLSQDRTSHL